MVHGAGQLSIINRPESVSLASRTCAGRDARPRARTEWRAGARVFTSARWVACCASLFGACALDAGPAPRPAQTAAAGAPSAVAPDEFTGPFPSWRNVRTQDGASGDGRSDDTAALQQSLAEAVRPGAPPVVFVPSGTYRITQTLTLSFAANVSLVGEDPATTRIVWDGPMGGTMLSINGVAYSRFARLTFDGRRRASVAVDQSWDGSRPNFDTGNEYADDRFLDVQYGIHGGFKGAGFAETSIVRSQFVRNSAAGVALGNFNALDIWIRDSLFEDCAVGVTNATGAGNFHVYSSVFRRSAVADLEMGNTGGFSARGNYSTGSRAFFVSSAAKRFPATIHLQRNTIVDPLETTVVDLKNQGPGLLTDNVIRSARAAGPAVRWTSGDGADVASIGNTYTVTRPIEASGRVISFGDRILPPADLSPAEPALPPTPPALGRRTFEVPRGAGAREVQAAISAAAAVQGQRPIVHFPAGVYAIDETLTVPATDLQLVGDGYGTILRWKGAGRGPVVRLEGPTHATLRELQIDGASSADGILVEGADQPGARLYFDQLQLRSARDVDLFVDRLDHALVQLLDFGHAYSPNARSVIVRGGPRAAAGEPVEGRTEVLSGAASGHTISYDVSDGARVLLRDLWYESGAGPSFAAVHGRAAFTIDGARLSTPVGRPRPAIDISDLDGTAALAAVHLDDRVVVAGSGRLARVLGLGLFDEQPSPAYVVNAAVPPAIAMLAGSRHRFPGTRGGNHSTPTPDLGRLDPILVDSLLAHTRQAAAAPLSTLPPSVTDLRLFRVWVAGGIVNLHVTP